MNAVPSHPPACHRSALTVQAALWQLHRCEWTAPRSGQYFDNLSPVNGQVFTEVARSTPRTSTPHSMPRTPQRTPGAAHRPHTARCCSTASPTASSRTWNCSPSPRPGTTASRSARRSMPTWPLMADHFRYFAGCLRAQEGSLSQIDDDTVAYHFHEPLGVVGQIIPWNFPLLMASWKMAPALAAGNCVVLKPAEQTPLGICVLLELIGDLLPPGVLNVVHGFGREAGKPLATSKRIAKIAFTGETTTGRLIMQYASQNLIPVTLELGGKSPNIFFADVMDADDDFFDKCLEGFAMFALNQGEVCTCPSRALIQESIYDRFMERVLERVAAIRQGNPLDPNTMVGAQASGEQLEKILSYIAIGREEGAEVLIGGDRAALGGHLAGGFLCAADRVQGPQRHARVPGGDLRTGGIGDPVQDRGRSTADRQRHAVWAGCRRLEPRCRATVPGGPRDSGGASLDQLLPCLPGTCGVRRLQAVGYRAREPPDDARPLPADQEPAGQLRTEEARLLLRIDRDQGAGMGPAPSCLQAHYGEARMNRTMKAAVAP
ncbi:aldehyde dehydrogenase family domain-containing protein [Ditylenchus destructor]|uniref:aldehyde dehydrogenase (NAD(+)) n=1 Tax=Ditylenchus destructor TaxID=166010 RepID=A0AAD4MEP3_9BILA|nr:aldehyde dehydrogenase family domain-containing protein [Ditylenchus destructor]